ncbi:MAG: glycosyltransferase family 4 protein [Methanobacterium sp.]
MTRILFIHNTAMWYRQHFFKELSNNYDIYFVFTHMQASKEIYDVQIDNEISNLKNVNYKVLKNYWGIAFGIIKEALGNYDVIVGGNWDNFPELVETIFYFTIAKIRKKKFILWSEEWDWNKKSSKRKLIDPIINLIVKNSNSIIVPGTKHKENFINMGAYENKIFIMPNACAYDSSRESKNQLNHKTIVYVGRLVERKGVQYLIKAFKKLKSDFNDSKLLIVGDGNYRTELEKLSEKIGVDGVYFCGQVDNNELKKYYEMCNICVIPSIICEMGDPWVFVLNEAMYYGMPVVATDAVGAAFDMIKNGNNGFIVPEKDSEALCESIKEILSNPVLEKNMGYKSKEIIKNEFTYKNMINGFNSALNYVINK